MAKLSVTTCLWFNGKIDEAARFYAATIPHTKVHEQKGPGGITISLSVAGHELMLLNGGPHFKLNEAASLFVSCETEAEADRLWAALTKDGGEESRCGWLKDKYGVSWQIVPPGFMEIMTDKDPARAKRAFDKMMTMTKLDVKALKKAADGG
jgi:predicted 3-demethylubiquinone-9 3-methyltransferase (glyoxalase superfamily)